MQLTTCCRIDRNPLCLTTADGFPSGAQLQHNQCQPPAPHVQVIAQGIIIDSFGQLRDENAQVLAQLKGACFICGLERAVLDRSPGGMEAHVAEHHNYWHYVSLFIFLQTADRRRFTDLEEYVYDCVQRGDAAWIPHRQCLATDAHATARQDVQMGSLREELAGLSRRLERMEAAADWGTVQQLHELLQGVAQRLDPESPHSPPAGRTLGRVLMQPTELARRRTAF